MKRGRKPKPKAALERDGTYRSDRHAVLDEAPQVSGVPEMPSGLNADALWMWRQIEESLTPLGVFGRIDTAIIWSCCDLWAKYREASEIASCDVLDKAARAAVIAYWHEWYRVGAAIGLSPLDRLKLKATAERKTEDPDAEFFKVVG